MSFAIPRRSAWVLVPPPLAFVVSFIVGARIGRAFGIALPESVASALGRPLGALTAALGAAFMISAPAMFAWRRTTIVPHGRARSLLTAGPYRVTRNPMYLGLAFVYVGTALALNHVAALPLLAIPFWVLSTKTIPYEEAMLQSIFGDDFRAYARRVRRWL